MESKTVRQTLVEISNSQIPGDILWSKVSETRKVVSRWRLETGLVEDLEKPLLISELENLREIVDEIVSLIRGEIPSYENVEET